MTEHGIRQPQVAAAIVTSRLGVLIGLRRDGNPPWTFPSGKIEPGESPEDAAVRETLEETRLRVWATAVVGHRMHPRTGVAITYVAAVPVDGTAAVADGEEIETVRWASEAEARELMRDMTPTVQEHIRRRLRLAASG